MSESAVGALRGTQPRRNLPAIALATLVLLVSAFVYLPGLSGGFIFDDIPTIVENPRIHAEVFDGESMTRAARSFDPGGTWGARPLAMVSFAINHVISGTDPWGYKFTGLLVHLINVALVLLLLRQLLPLLPGDSREWVVPGTVVIALAWAIHPLQVSTVLYVVQRMETLSYTFVLLALLAYLHARTCQLQGRRAWPWLLGCILLLLLGMAVKESAILLPAFTLAMELTVLGFGAQQRSTARAWRWVYGLSVVTALIVFAFVAVPHYWADSHSFRDFGTAERLLTQLRVLPLYLSQILLPLPGSMTFYYDDFVVSRGLLEPPGTLFGGLLVMTLGVAAFMLRKRMPLFSLGLLWFFAAHWLTSNVVALELVFEHRNYFASLGIILAVADLVRRIRVRASPSMKYVVLGAVIAALATLTFIRASTWGDPFLLATDLVDRNPQSGRASADLAAIYLEMTDGYANSPFNDFAMREFERGSLIPGSSIISDQGLILTAVQAGREVDDVWWQRLIQKIRTGSLPPETSQALFGLLRNRYKGVELDDDRLVDAFLAFFERATLPAHSYARFGDYVLTKTGDEDLADQVFAKSIEQSGSNPEYARQVVETLIKGGHLRQAQVALAKAQSMGMLMDMAELQNHLVPLKGGTDKQ